MVRTLIADEGDLSVEGFQIQANNDHDDDTVSFRTVCKAPNIGQEITVNETPYTVKAYGTIYALDFTNTSGDHEKDNLQPYHTLLAKGLQDIGKGDEKVKAYVGSNKFGGKIYTYGYEATPIGTINGWDELDDTHTYYSRTMIRMDDYMANTIHVRAFVVTNNDEFIYSEDIVAVSVAEIADYLYQNSMSKNKAAHDYLYDKILHNSILSEGDNKFYRPNPIVEYGWNSNLYTPKNVYTGKTA